MSGLSELERSRSGGQTPNSQVSTARSLVRTSHVMSTSFWLSLISVNAPLLRFTRPHFSVRPAPNLLLASEPGDALPRVAPSPTILSFFRRHYGPGHCSAAAGRRAGEGLEASARVPGGACTHTGGPESQGQAVDAGPVCQRLLRYAAIPTTTDGPGLPFPTHRTGYIVRRSGSGSPSTHPPSIGEASHTSHLGWVVHAVEVWLPFQRLDVIICLYRSSPVLPGRCQTMVPGCSRSPTGWVPPRAVP